MSDPQIAFLDADSLKALGGATLAVSVLANTMQVLLKRRSPWIAFAASVLVIVVIGLNAKALHSPADMLLAIANTCLLFCTASGIQSAVAQTPSRTGNQLAPPDSSLRGWRRFIQSWFQTN